MFFSEGREGVCVDAEFATEPDTHLASISARRAPITSGGTESGNETPDRGERFEFTRIGFFFSSHFFL